MQDSERDDELAPEANLYKEKDVINIEDGSKSFKIIFCLSNETDDDNNPKPPTKRPRLKLDR